MTLRRRFSSFVFMLALAILVPGAYAADQAEQDRNYSKFIHHMHDKEYQQAVELAFTRAKAGDGWARARVEEWYARSGDPDDSPPPVVRMVDARLSKAASEGDAESQFVLGYRALKEDTRAGFATGVAWLEKAADQGHKIALYVLGQMSRKGLASMGIASRYAGKE